MNGKEYFFSVSNGFSRFVFNADYLQVVAEDSLIEEYVQKHPLDSIFGYKEMVHLGGELYQITDVSRSGDQLTLKRHPKDEPWRGTQMGALACEIDTITLAGDKYRVPNGKITMIDFWGTWCGPCIGELPFLKDAHALFAEDQFELIGIASDDREDLQKFVEENEIHWPQIHQGKENRGIIEQYGIRGYPTTFLIDREGKIIAKNSTLRGHQLVETLANVLEISENNLQQKITEGSVLIKISGEKHENWIIKGDFTDDQSIPLYLVEDKWQRGFTLKPGQYSYELKSRNRVSETLEGSFVVHAQEEPIEIVLPSLANL